MAAVRPVQSKLASLEHTNEMHMKAVSVLCRLCDKRSMRQREGRKKGMGRRENSCRLPVSNDSTSKLIKDFCGFSTSDDTPGVHPPNICRSCYNILHRKNKDPYSGFIAKSNELNMKWKPYERGSTLMSCFPCMMYANHSLAGRIKCKSNKKKINKLCEYCNEELPKKQTSNHICYDEKYLYESVSDKMDHFSTPPKECLTSDQNSRVPEPIQSNEASARPETPTSEIIPITCASTTIPNDRGSLICEFCHTNMTNQNQGAHTCEDDHEFAHLDLPGTSQNEVNSPGSSDNESSIGNELGSLDILMSNQSEWNYSSSHDSNGNIVVESVPQSDMDPSSAHNSNANTVIESVPQSDLDSNSANAHDSNVNVMIESVSQSDIDSIPAHDSNVNIVIESVPRDSSPTPSSLMTDSRQSYPTLVNMLKTQSRHLNDIEMGPCTSSPKPSPPIMRSRFPTFTSMMRTQMPYQSPRNIVSGRPRPRIMADTFIYPTSPSNMRQYRAQNGLSVYQNPLQYQRSPVLHVSSQSDMDSSSSNNRNVNIVIESVPRDSSPNPSSLITDSRPRYPTLVNMLKTQYRHSNEIELGPHTSSPKPSPPIMRSRFPTFTSMMRTQMPYQSPQNTASGRPRPRIMADTFISPTSPSIGGQYRAQNGLNVYQSPLQYQWSPVCPSMCFNTSPFPFRSPVSHGRMSNPRLRSLSHDSSFQDHDNTFYPQTPRSHFPVSHSRSETKSYSPGTKDRVLLDIINNKSTTPSRLEKKAASQTMGKLQSSSKLKGRYGEVELPTGGLPSTWLQIPKARKPSTEVKTPEKRSRARVSDVVRKIIAGPTESDTTIQMTTEIKRLSNDAQNEIAQATGWQGAYITAKLALAIKANVGLTWKQQMRLNRFLNPLGMRQASQAKQRDLKSDLIGDHLIGYKINFESRDSDNELISLPLPYVAVKNIQLFVFERIDAYRDTGMLSWHTSIAGSLPHHKIYIKVGGDKGQGSTKITLQVCNTPKPNSPNNTLIIAVFEAADTYTNLGIALDGIEQQLEALDGMKYMCKSCREGQESDCGQGCIKDLELCGSGDLDFMAKVLGIAGASSTHPCTYCKINKNDMKYPKSERGTFEMRTQKNLRDDYLDFAKSGCNINEQSKYSNVINPPLLHIEPNRFSIPLLHLVMGNTKKMHLMLEGRLFELDLEILISDAGKKLCATDPKRAILAEKKDELVILTSKLTKHIQDMKELKDECEDDMLLSEIRGKDRKLAKLEDEVNKLQKKKKEIEKSLQLKQGIGPLCLHVEEKLQEHGIHRQKYHGRSFVGEWN